jgi:hypothetical protein
LSGLITAVSEEQHSFQIGFTKGQIVYLSYRIVKGVKALDKIRQINSAKIVEHLGIDPPKSQTDLPDSGSIMTLLTTEQQESEAAQMLDSRYELPPSPSNQDAASVAKVIKAKTPAKVNGISSKQLNVIKDAAVHHFGPIGAMVCEDHLSDSDLTSIDLRTLLMRIVEDVGASESEAGAFARSVGL